MKKLSSIILLMAIGFISQVAWANDPFPQGPLTCSLGESACNGGDGSTAIIYSCSAYCAPGENAICQSGGIMLTGGKPGCVVQEPNRCCCASLYAAQVCY